MKVRIFAMALLSASLAVNAQNIYQMEDYSSSELNGTARYVGMGGAMNALGADISLMNSNPAGLGLYRRSDVAGTLSVVTQPDAQDFNNKSGTHISFDQLGLVYSMNVDGSTTKFVNLGLSYRKHKNFNRLIGSGSAFDGNQGGPSLSWQMYDLADFWGPNDGSIKDGKTATPLAHMGHETYLYDVENDGVYNASANSYHQAQWGSIQDFGVSLGFNFSEQFYLGFTLGLYNVDYNSYSEYAERLVDYTLGPINDQFLLTNRHEVSGTGVDVKAGLIVRPIEENPFRIGVSVASPTYYSLRSRKHASLVSDLSMSQGDIYDYGYNLDYKYNLYTPWKFNISLGTTFFNQLAIGAEYEYSDYSASKITYDTGDYDYWGNSDSEKDEAIKAQAEKYLKGVSTFKIGAEWFVDPKLCIRLGYNYVTSSVSKNAFYNQFINSVSLDCATSAAYMNPSDINRLTVGMGTSLGKFYADIACMFQFQHGDFYAFSTQQGNPNVNNDLPSTRVKLDRTQVMLTLGYRF